MSKQKKKEVTEELVENFEYKPVLSKLLNVVSAILAFVLICVIYLPTVIWDEEDAYRSLGRKRMVILNKVQDYYQGITGTYQEDPILAMKLLTAVRDSTKADSNYFGAQVLKIDGSLFEVDVEKNFFLRFDTSFAFSYQKKDSVIDTICKVLKYNNELFTFDTLYFNSKNLGAVEYDSLLDKEIQRRTEKFTYYNPYYLVNNFAYHPLTNDQFALNVKTEGEKDVLTIKDPMEGEYREPRFLVFTFKDTSYGSITDGERSWK